MFNYYPVNYELDRGGPMRKSEPSVTWKPLLIKAPGEKKKIVETSANIIKKWAGAQKKTSKTMLYNFSYLKRSGKKYMYVYRLG